MASGAKDKLEKFLEDLKKKYQMKANMLGPGGDEKKEGMRAGLLENADKI